MFYRNSFTPLYKQLADFISTKIQSRELVPGMAIPSERQLSEDHNLSRVTVRKAIDCLMRQGYLIRSHGKNTIVAGRERGDPDGGTAVSGLLLGVIDELGSKNIHPEIVLVSAGFLPATADLRRILAFSKMETNAFRYARLFLHQGTPLLFSDSHVPEVLGHSIQDLDFSKDRVLHHLECFGYAIARADQSIGLCQAGGEAAECLGVRPGDLLLMDEKTIFLDNGTPICFIRNLYRPDRHTFTFSLTRKPNVQS